MLHLNLISEKLKQNIKLRYIYKILKRTIFLLIVITIFVAIIFLVSKIILQNSFNKIVEQTTLITKNSQGRNTKIREINIKINYVDEIQNNYIEWSYLLEDLAKNINNNIIFNCRRENFRRCLVLVFQNGNHTKDTAENTKWLKPHEYEVYS